MTDTRIRLLVGAAALALLVFGAGCLGGGSITDEQLNENATYDWDTDTNVTITVQPNEFQAVYQIRNRSRIELYRDGFSSRNPLRIRAVQFRHENGTFVNGSALTVTKEGGNTVVELPARDGTLAFTADSGPKEFSVPAYVEGSYEVILPPNRRAGNIVFGHIAPSNPTRSVDDQNRLHLRWESVNRNVFVRYYLQRDLLIFGGFVALLALVGFGGLGYYLYQIRILRERREEMGLDVDTGGDDGDGPPPGLR